MPENISVLIVEDEEIWLRNYELSLKEFGFDIAASIRRAGDAITAFRDLEYDIVLLDIHLEGKNSGIELGKILNTVYKKPFIFITASFDGHNMMEAAAAKPSAYLTKPVNTSSLFIAINSALNNFNNHQAAGVPDAGDGSMSSFFVKNGNKYKKIEWNDVVYLSSGKNYVSLFNARDKSEYHIRSSLQNAMSYIIPGNLQHLFMQVNRGEVVQLPYIQEIIGDEIKTLYKNFYMSDGYCKDLKKRLNLLS